ncbi:MAG: ABC transporter ATP-binding protein [Promethearchaeota archaeon]
MVKIVMKNIEKRFGKELVIPDMNLVVEDKEFLVLVGPSGCGKSTMLNLIAGLEYPTGGTIYFDDREVSYVNPRDRNIAMVFQSYALYPHMNTYENLAFSLRLSKMGKKEIDERVKRAAKILQIEELLEKKPKQMSGGQRQRVALGRAIVRNPSVFLLDEPLSNLDAKLRVEMRGEIIRLQKSLETTLCYVTHDQVEAMSMADRIAIINKGRIQQVATPFEAYNFPHNVFVGGFIGSPSMNFTQGMILQEGSDFFLNFVGGKIKLIGKRAEAAKEFLQKCREENRKSKVTVGIRPEHLYTGYKPEECECLVTESDVSELVETPTKDSENVLKQGTVFVVEHLGAGTYVTLEATLERHTAVQLEMGEEQERIGIMVDGYFDTKINDQLYLRFYEPYLHLFDSESNENILNLIK